MLHRLPRLAAALAPALLVGACALAPAAPDTVDLRLIAFNDFHGNLQPPPGGWVAPDPASPGRLQRIPAGGLAHLATAVRELRAQKSLSLVVGAGDLVSASPLISSLFHDEPSVALLGAAGLEIASVGNHEFDRGRAELKRLVEGGCHPKGCVDGPWPGAPYRYLAANVIDTATGRPFLPAYEIRELGGVKVAFVGAVVRGMQTLVDPRGIRGLAFLDEADAVNAVVPGIRAQGVEAIVLLIHEGGSTTGAFDDASCPGFEGAILDIVRRLDKAVDVVVSGHTHQAYRCRFDGRLVTSAGSYGRIVTAIDLTIDRGTREVTRSEARNVLVDPAVFPADAAIAARIERIAALAQDRAGRIVGRVEGEFAPLPNAAGESNLGALVADAMLASARPVAGAQVALMNPGGLRAPLASKRPDGGVSYGDLFSVQPFGNTLVTASLTGAQLLAALEQQWRAPPDRTRILPVAGLAYAWDGRRPLGSRVDAGSVRVAGQPLVAQATYRVVMNSFLFGGGDGFSALAQASDPVVGETDMDAFEAWIAREPRRAGPPPGRIRRVDIPGP